MTLSYRIYGIKPDKERVFLFTWNYSAESGITQAIKEAKENRMYFVGYSVEVKV